MHLSILTPNCPKLDLTITFSTLSGSDRLNLDTVIKTMQRAKTRDDLYSLVISYPQSGTLKIELTLFIATLQLNIQQSNKHC